MLPSLSPQKKRRAAREKGPPNRRRHLVTRHSRRRLATAALDSRGFEPRLRFARPACFQLHHEPIRPAKESNLQGLPRAHQESAHDSGLAPCRSASRTTTERKVQVPAVSLVLF